MRKALLSLLLLAVATSTGCATAAEDDDDSASDENALATGTALKVSMQVAESKLVFSSRVLSFSVKDGQSLNLPCRNAAVGWTSKPTLYSGWSPERFAEFGEDVEDAQYRDYVFATCRSADTHVLGWFPKEREYELTVEDQFLDKDYKPTKNPLFLQRAKLGSGAPTYYACNSKFKKTQTGETNNEKRFDIEVVCKARPKPTSGELGVVDFVASPGPYASVASYRAWTLPPVASTAENLERVRTAFLGKVAAGKYEGAMSTLSKKCTLEVKTTADGISIDHTIQSSNRKRHIELKAADLLGFAEGDLYSDLNRVTDSVTGKFAAGEFREASGESTVIRFEKNDTADGLIVRVDGSETYCRRLMRQ